MIPAIICSLPKYHERLDIFEGWRVCAPTVPGLVVIHKDRNVAATLVVCAVSVLIEDELESISRNCS